MITKSIHSDILKYKGAFKGKECLVVSCGPSLKSVDINKLKDICKDRVVIAIKQAYGIMPELVDFHVFNCNTFTSFEKNKNTVTIACSSDTESNIRRAAWGNHKVDIFLRNKSGVPIEETLAYKGNYDDWEYEKTIDRPAGPAIIHEVVVNMLSLFEVSKVYFFGWDLASPEDVKNNKYTHFYRDLSIPLKKVGYANPKSFDLLIKTSYNLYEWFGEKGISMEIVSDISLLDDRIPRKQIQNIGVM